MARYLVLDFTGQTPVQMTGGSDHVPAGRYPLTLRRIDDTTAASSGNRMLRASLSIEGGDYHGKRISDTFSLGGDSSLGLQRAMTFLLALGLPIQQGAVQLDLDQLVGQRCLADLIDNTIPANERYPERLVSRPASYYTVNGVDPQSWFENGRLKPGAQQAQAQATAAAAQMQAAPPPPAPPVQAAVEAPAGVALNGNVEVAAVDPAAEAAARAAAAFEQ